MASPTLRIRACVNPSDLAKFTLIEVQGQDELEKIAIRLDVPILDCDRDGFDLVLDPRDKLAYEVKKS